MFCQLSTICLKAASLPCFSCSTKVFSSNAGVFA
jgi:hypothetical protein